MLKKKAMAKLLKLLTTEVMVCPDQKISYVCTRISGVNLLSCSTMATSYFDIGV
jgi:hypothetical protein